MIQVRWREELCEVSSYVTDSSNRRSSVNGTAKEDGANTCEAEEGRPELTGQTIRSGKMEAEGAVKSGTRRRSASGGGWRSTQAGWAGGSK